MTTCKHNFKIANNRRGGVYLFCPGCRTSISPKDVGTLKSDNDEMRHEVDALRAILHAAVEREDDPPLCPGGYDYPDWYHLAKDALIGGEHG